MVEVMRGRARMGVLVSIAGLAIGVGAGRGAAPGRPRAAGPARGGRAVAGTALDAISATAHVAPEASRGAHAL